MLCLLCIRGVLCGVLLLRVGCSGQMCNYCLMSLFVLPCLCLYFLVFVSFLVYKLYIVRVKESCNRRMSVKPSGEPRPASELASGSGQIWWQRWDPFAAKTAETHGRATRTSK